jgi:hypothetical protein
MMWLNQWVTFKANQRLYRCLSIGQVLLHELTFCALGSP